MHEGLLLFATPAEAGPLLALLDQPVPEPGHLRRLPIAGGWRLGITGMGAEAVSRSLARWAAAGVAPRLVLGAGVAGCLDRRFGIGEIALVDRVRRERGGGLRLSIPGRGGVRTAGLVSVTRPVFGRQRRRRLAGRGSLVDMEGFALVTVCRRLRWPCRLLKVVSDQADNRRSLRRNLAPVSALLADTLMEALAHLAPEQEER